MTHVSPMQECGNESSSDSDDDLTVAQRLARRQKAPIDALCTHPGCQLVGVRSAWGCDDEQSLRCDAHAALRCECSQCRRKTPRGQKTRRIDSIFTIQPQDRLKWPQKETLKGIDASHSGRRSHKSSDEGKEKTEEAPTSSLTVGAATVVDLTGEEEEEEEDEEDELDDRTNDDKEKSVGSVLPSLASRLKQAGSSKASSIRQGIEKSKLRFNSMSRGKCVVCRKPLQRVGTDRANGVRHHADWSNRQYHKKCLKARPDLAADSNWIKTFYNS